MVLQYIGFFLAFLCLPFMIILSRSHWTPQGFMTLTKKISLGMKVKKELLTEGRYHFLFPFHWIVKDSSNRIVDIPVSIPSTVTMFKEYTTSDGVTIAMNIVAQYIINDSQRFLSDIINKDKSIVETQGMNEYVLCIIDDECKRCISNMSIQASKDLSRISSDIEHQVARSLAARRKSDYIEFKIFTLKNTTIQIDPSNTAQMNGLMKQWYLQNKDQKISAELEYIKKVLSFVNDNITKGSNVSLTINCGDFLYSCNDVSSQLVMGNIPIKS